MGRVKLKIKKLENPNGRQSTYSKRKNGIMKKANELSILCDIDIILLMFSPTGKPSLCSGKHSSIEEVIAKFAQLTPQERAKRRLESLEVLKKTFKKLDHDVNVQEFLGTSSQTAEDLTTQASLLQTQLSEIRRRLSYWSNPEKNNSVEHLGQMENSLKDSLNQIQAYKENLGKQLVPLECSGQLQNAMHIPFRMGAEQQIQAVSWMPNNDNRQMSIPEDPNLLPHKDVEGSTSSSFGSYSGYFSAGRSSDISNPGQESGIINELCGTSSFRVQLGGQYPYSPYNINLLSDPKFQPLAEMNFQENGTDYHFNEGSEAPGPRYQTTQGHWISTSGQCAVAMFQDYLYSQQPN